MAGRIPEEIIDQVLSQTDIVDPVSYTHLVAGQLSGVEGYMESAASGLLTGRFIRHLLEGKTKDEAIGLLPSEQTMIGALHQYVIASPTSDYQPMNANFGLFAATDDQPRKKDLRRQFFIERSDQEIKRVLGKEDD